MPNGPVHRHQHGACAPGHLPFQFLPVRMVCQPNDRDAGSFPQIFEPLLLRSGMFLVVRNYGPRGVRSVFGGDQAFVLEKCDVLLSTDRAVNQVLEL